MERAKPARLAKRWGGGGGVAGAAHKHPRSTDTREMGKATCVGHRQPRKQRKSSEIHKNKAEEKCWYGQALGPGADDPQAQSRTPTPPLGQHLHKTVFGFHLPTAFCSC